MTRVLVRDIEENRSEEGGKVTTETEAGGMLPQARTTCGHRKPEEAGDAEGLEQKLTSVDVKP